MFCSEAGSKFYIDINFKKIRVVGVFLQVEENGAMYPLFAKNKGCLVMGQ